MNCLTPCEVVMVALDRAHQQGYIKREGLAVIEGTELVHVPSQEGE